MKRRLSVFLNLLKTGRADAVSLDIDNSDAIMKLLDAGIVFPFSQVITKFPRSLYTACTMTSLNSKVCS